MPMPDFDGYLDRATANIRSKRRRDEVREELCAHLEDAAAYHASRGLSELEAKCAALDEMGDAGDLALKLGEIHSFFPAKDMRNAINLLIAGLILINFRPDFWYIGELIPVAGTLLILFALYRLRVCSRLLKITYVFFAAVFALSAAVTLISALPLFPSMPVVPAPVRYAWYTLTPAAFALSMVGIGRLLPEKYGENLYAAAAFYFLVCTVVVIAHAGALFLVASVVFAVMALCPARNYLWANDLDLGITELPARKRTALIAAAVIAAMLPYCAAFAVTSLPPESENYTPGEKDAQTEAVIAELMGQGVGKELLYDMRHEDIKRLEGAALCGNSTLYASSHLSWLGEMTFRQYLFDTPDGNFMALISFDVPSEKTRAMQLALQSPAGGLCFDAENASAVCLHEKGGRTVMHGAHVESYSGACGMELKLVRNAGEQRGYFLIPIELICEGAHDGRAASELYSGYMQLLGIYVQKDALRLPFSYDNMRRYDESIGISYSDGTEDECEKWEHIGSFVLDFETGS